MCGSKPRAALRATEIFENQNPITFGVHISTLGSHQTNSSTATNIIITIPDHLAGETLHHLDGGAVHSGHAPIQPRSIIIIVLFIIKIILFITKIYHNQYPIHHHRLIINTIIIQKF